MQPIHTTHAVEALRQRHAVTVEGDPDGPTVVLAHGFGCDQRIWDAVVERLVVDHRIVRFDHAGSGASDPAAHDPVRHATIDGYAADAVSVCRALGLRGATWVGHSVSGMIGALASTAAPELFDQLVLIGASARYVDDEGYVGGMTSQDVEEVLQTIEDNYVGWAHVMAPVIMGNPDRPELAGELDAVFARLDPGIATAFARATFRTDVRDRLGDVPVPALVVHCAEDAIVPDEAAAYLHRHLPRSAFHQLAASGHCPLLSAPDEVASAVRSVTTAPVTA